MVSQPESSKLICDQAMSSPVRNFQGPTSSTDESPSFTCATVLVCGAVRGSFWVAGESARRRCGEEQSNSRKKISPARRIRRSFLEQVLRDTRGYMSHVPRLRRKTLNVS